MILRRIEYQRTPDLNRHRESSANRLRSSICVEFSITGSHSCVRRDAIGATYEHYDYSDYPEFADSVGFTQRGCRLNYTSNTVRIGVTPTFTVTMSGES